MKSIKLTMTAALLAGLGLTGASHAAINTVNEQVLSDGATIDVVGGTYTDATGVGDDIFMIDQSITLSADKWYNMNTRVVVAPGASLTIQAGTVIASTKQPQIPGTLVITRDAQIFALGTADEPIIFTSRVDLGNWADDASHPTGKNPRDRGVWRPGMFEWGSIAINGRARISDDRQNPANGTEFSELKEAPMEGLPTLTGGINLYGGLDDNDDSGVFKYVSTSYGGFDFDPTKQAELNGISTGGVGRGTDFHHVEIFNNVDDGLEIFGGTLNIKNLLIWNIGDDSLDIDQGYRGKVQFALIVQGAAEQNVGQGSGFGDNAFEVDGVDGDTAAQPVTAIAIWNATAIGAPRIGGTPSTDRLIALRDNANVQWWNSIFMTDGNNILNNDGDDTDGSDGYGGSLAPGGTNGTLSFVDRWTTTADWYHDPSNGFPNQGSAGVNDFLAAYTAQDPTANLLQIAGSVWFDIFNAGQAINVGVLPGISAGSENPALDNFVSASSPIVSIVRATNPGDGVFFMVESGGDNAGNVMSLDPRAAGDAIETNRTMKFQPPADGFYTTPTNFRGAVAPNFDWLQGWTAISAIKNNAGNFILASPANPAGPSGTDLDLTATVSFMTIADVLYEVVCVDADGNEQVVTAVVGTGSEVVVTDTTNVPVDASKKYIVRIATQ